MRCVDVRQRRAQLAQVGADLDRREQQKRTVLGEDGPAELRAARQLQQRWRSACFAKARRDTGLPSSCWSCTFMLCVTSSTITCSNSERSHRPAGVQEAAGQCQRRSAEQPAVAAVAPRCAQALPRAVMAGPASSRASSSPRVRRCAAGRPARPPIVGVGQQALRALQVVARVPVLRVAAQHLAVDLLGQFDQRDRLAGLGSGAHHHRLAHQQVGAVVARGLAQRRVVLQAR